MLKVTEGAKGVHVSGGAHDDREGIGELFSRAVTEGKAFASAEVNVYKTMALAKVDAAKSGVVFLVAGGVLALTGLIALMVKVADWIDDGLDLGPLLGGILTLAVAGLIGFVLIKMGTSRMAKVSTAGTGNSSTGGA